VVFVFGWGFIFAKLQKMRISSIFICFSFVYLCYMQFEEILGQEPIKKFLKKNIDNGRIPNTQLFVGPEGSGTLPMALAYSGYLLGKNSSNPEMALHNVSRLIHPDVHFVFPTFTNDKIKSKAKSSDFLPSWRDFVSENPYGGLFDWYQYLESDNKQGEIRAEDANEVGKILSLKSYEGGYKVLIVWMADKMNATVSNRLLKTLEEPNEKTVVILITEHEEDLIQTIRSRCQTVHFSNLSETDIVESLISKYSVEPIRAKQIAHQSQGNYNKAIKLIFEDSDPLFEKWFVSWIRAAFKAKNNPSAIHDLISFSDVISKQGRESQKKFISYCLEMFRQAMLINYQMAPLVYVEPSYQNFKLENFAPFVNGNNILGIYQELSDAQYLIERNGNAKIILTNLSIKLTRLIHKK
jgi:DNA polymerase III subunit delta'